MNLTNYLAQESRKWFRCDGPEGYSGVGFSCEHMQQGDCLVLIAGVSLPMVIWKQENRLKIISLAFLGGAINGELC
jgi:hypothetical protein